MNQDEKNLVLLCHLSALAMFVMPFGNVIGPLVVWLFKKDSSPIVDAEGKEVLNFQITVAIAAAIALILSFALIGIPLLVVIGVSNLVLIIIAALEVSKGNSYRYPINLRLIK